jgi:phosphoenolpyruvate synthase/pyruvate phosphate dikinase
MKTIFPFTSNDLPDMDQVGGKALALIQMTRAGMPVPPGFVLTVKFFDPWIERLKQPLDCAEQANADVSTILWATKAARKLCHDLTLNEQQRGELRSALNQFQSNNHGHLLAIRSSSPEEDLEGASFAGGYETSLGVTDKTIEAAILHSFTSSFDERIILY